MKTIYAAIKRQLQEQVPALRQVSMNVGQLSVAYTERSRPPLAYPAVLVDIEVSTASNVTTHTQLCQGSVTLTIVTDVVNNIDDERATAPYDLVAEVYKSLQGFYSDHFSPLSRTRGARVHPSSHAQLFTYRMIFAVEFIDGTAENKG